MACVTTAPILSIRTNIISMSVVLCDLFRSHYDSEHSEKVTECPLCTMEEAWHDVSCSDLDITRRPEEHADEKQTTSTQLALYRSICLLSTVSQHS